MLCDRLTYMWVCSHLIYITSVYLSCGHREEVEENICYTCLSVEWVLVKPKETGAGSENHILWLRLCAAPPELVAP